MKAQFRTRNYLPKKSAKNATVTSEFRHGWQINHKRQITVTYNFDFVLASGACNAS